MYTSPTSRLPAAAALMAAVGLLTGSVLAEEQIKGSEIPNDAYYGDKLTPSERSGIESEEAVTPNDGKASVPPSDLQGVIPDAADPEKGDTTVATPPDGALPGDVAPKKGKSKDDEAEVILKQSKESFRVTKSELDKCIKQWDPQTQMTKQEWAESCRTTLQYDPEGEN
jgi:hypothetical protein